MLKLLRRFPQPHRCSVMCYIVKYRARFCGTSIGSQRFYAIKKSTRGNDRSPASVQQPVDLSKLPIADQFGVLSAQADSGHFPLHSSLKGRAVAHMKITDEILHEPLEDQVREQGLHRSRDHPRYQRNSQLLAKYCKEGNVEAACSQFFDIMLTEERVMPSRFDAHGLLDALANSGRSADAFKVYQKLKELGISPTQATFSRLFRSMLQRALPTEHLLEQFGGPGLQRAQMLYQELRHKGIQLTQVTYNTLLLALARGGDIQSCMATLDDMLKAAKYNSPKNPIRIDEFTISAVLSGIKPAVAKHQLAISLQQQQLSRLDLFQFMLSLWHRLISSNVELSSHIFVLLLGALKCIPRGNGNDSTLRIEPPDSAVTPSFSSSTQSELLESTKGQLTPPVANDGSQDMLQPLDETMMENVIQLDWEDTSFSMHSPVNLLTPTTRAIQVVPPYNGWLPWQRLALFGGLHGFLNTVETVGNTKPEIRIFTELIGLLPPAKATSTQNNLDQWEVAILDAARQRRILLDMPFYNALINRRTAVGVSAECLLAEATRMGLSPDQATWGSLARACKSVASVKQLLTSLADASSPASSNTASTPHITIRPSLAFFASLLSANRFNWDLKAFILQLMMGEQENPNSKVPNIVVIPDRRMIASLEIEVALFRRLLSKGSIPKDGSAVDAGPDTDGVPIPPFAAAAFRRFLTVYQRWLHWSFQEESPKSCMVNVITADGRTIVGTLKGFDNVINLVIKDSQERVFSPTEGVEQVPLGLFIIRGQNV
ncbi:LSM domain protein [Opisthorchis viverrini]|uniref:LSM domain protein n=1 Tax=Opisthorchis viverrini TaxID=6198 RepID=A0A1S8WTV9_OPIVI|nr:LSM domain protein [Opisthorchis viverrini]